MRHKTLVLAALLSAGLLAGCGDSGTATTSSMESMDDHSEFAFGEPASAADADQTIEIAAFDDFRFDPAEITVSAGEVVTFRIVNQGEIPHDFTLGDEATQAEHEEEMAEMEGMSMSDEANAVSLPVGETKEVTWRFTEPGSVLIGCHQAGHYAAGMRAEVTIQG